MKKNYLKKKKKRYLKQNAERLQDNILEAFTRTTRYEIEQGFMVGSLKFSQQLFC